MTLLYNLRKEFPRRFNMIKAHDLDDGISYRMRSRSPSSRALLTLEAHITKRPGENHYLDVIQTNALPNSRALAVFSDLGIPQSIIYGEVGHEDSMFIQRDEEYDKFLRLVGRHISPLFAKLAEQDIKLLETFPSMRPYIAI